MSAAAPPPVSPSTPAPAAFKPLGIGPVAAQPVSSPGAAAAAAPPPADAAHPVSPPPILSRISSTCAGRLVAPPLSVLPVSLFPPAAADAQTLVGAVRDAPPEPRKTARRCCVPTPLAAADNGL